MCPWLVPTAIMGPRPPLPGMGREVRNLAGPTSLGPAGQPYAIRAGALVSRRLGEKLVQVDVDLARCLDVADLKAIDLEAVFHQSDFLDADPLLPRIRNDEAGGGRPDVANAAKREIPPLMDM